MLRPVLTELVLFLIPFALYALYVFLTKPGGVLEPANWPLKHVLTLAIIAFLCVITSFLVLAQWSGAPAGSTYIPAHFKDGKFYQGETVYPPETKSPGEAK